MIRDFFKRAVAYLKPKPAFSIPAADGPGTVRLNYGPPPPSIAKRAVDMDRLIDEHMPPTTKTRFRNLIKVYAEMEIEFPYLKGITVAQWAIESQWGASRAAREEGNYAGMKWREGDRKYGGTPSKVSGFDGYERNVRYSHFDTNTAFIRAYWGRLDEATAYRGWRKHVQSPITFISNIGPPWVGYETDRYVKKVIDIWQKRTRYLFDEK